MFQLVKKKKKEALARYGMASNLPADEEGGKEEIDGDVIVLSQGSMMSSNSGSNVNVNIGQIFKDLNLSKDTDQTPK